MQGTLEILVKNDRFEIYLQYQEVEFKYTGALTIHILIFFFSKLAEMINQVKTKVGKLYSMYFFAVLRILKFFLDTSFVSKVSQK